MKMFVTVNFLGGEYPWRKHKWTQATYWLEKSSATNVTL